MNTTITRDQFMLAFEKVFGNSHDKLFDEIFKGFTTKT